MVSTRRRQMTPNAKAAAPGWTSSWNLDFEVVPGAALSTAATTAAATRWMRGQLVVVSTTMASFRDVGFCWYFRFASGRHEEGEAFLLSGVEQFSILELRPTSLVSGYDLMLRQ